ncbi:hypothetical protein D3C78_1575560 [compost metagenome]
MLVHAEIEPAIVGRITRALLDRIVGPVARQYGNVISGITIEAIMAKARDHNVIAVTPGQGISLCGVTANQYVVTQTTGKVIAPPILANHVVVTSGANNSILTCCTVRQGLGDPEGPLVEVA